MKRSRLKKELVGKRKLNRQLDWQRRQAMEAMLEIREPQLEPLRQDHSRQYVRSRLSEVNREKLDRFLERCGDCSGYIVERAKQAIFLERDSEFVDKLDRFSEEHPTLDISSELEDDFGGNATGILLWEIDAELLCPC
jgi:hypothetical protein